MTQPWPIVGRDADCAAIVARLRRGVGTFIVGEAGLGKSVLAREVQRKATDDGWSTQLVLCSGSSDFTLPPAPEGAVAEKPMLLLVDDAHLLSDQSADLLWRLGAAGPTRILATVRRGERVPDRVARLWTGGSCERFEMRPLTEPDIRQLLEHLLDGDVEDRLPRLLVQRCGGNALLMRELIHSGLSSGAIARSHQVWRLVGELPVGDGVTELIRTALSGLSDLELEAAQLIALGEPLRLELAEETIGAQAMETLERERIVMAQETADGPVLTLAHPLYGEVIRTDMLPLRSQRLRRELLRAIALAKVNTSNDVLRSALWRLELHEPVDAAELVAAALLARASHLATAERLARAALHTDDLRAQGPIEAVLLLGEILVMQGRIVEAERLLDGIDLSTVSETQRQNVAYARTLGRTRLGEAAAAATMSSGNGSGTNSLQLQAVRAQALLLDGSLDEALALARPVFDDETADPIARTVAAVSLLSGGIFAGTYEATERIQPAALTVARAARSALPYGVPTAMVSAVFVQANAGHLDRAGQLAAQLNEQALSEDDDWMRPRGASGLGAVALLRGQVRTATRYFRITVASLNEFDRLFLRFNLSCLARAAALAGLVREARTALQPPAEAPRFLCFESDWEIAEAAVLAAEGDVRAATGVALRAARSAASRGQWGVALVAAHDSVRYSGSAEAADLVTAAAEYVDGPLSSCLSHYAQARAAADFGSLVESSRRFEAAGAILYAAEASYAAAHAYRDAGEGRAAAQATVRAGELHARCEDASISWVSGFHAIAALTTREQQVALLAAAGRPDLAISVELGVSVRTVQTHLLRAYAKLGITGRRQLAEVL